jgi:hypothetical protein
MNYPSQIASQRCHIEDHVVEPTNRNLLPSHSARPVSLSRISAPASRGAAAATRVVPVRLRPHHTSASHTFRLRLAVPVCSSLPANLPSPHTCLSSSLSHLPLLCSRLLVEPILPSLLLHDSNTATYKYDCHSAELIASCHTVLERSKQLALRETHRRLSWRFGWRERRPSWRAAPREVALFTSLATAIRGHGSWARRRRCSQHHHRRRRRWEDTRDSAPSGGSLLGTVAPLPPPFPRMSCRRTA